MYEHSPFVVWLSSHLLNRADHRTQLILHPLLQRRRPQHSTHRVIGDLALYKFTLIEFDDNKDAPTDQPTFDDVNLIRICADGSRPIFSMDDASQLDGIWKFKDRIEDRLSIALPNSPE